MVHVNVRVQEAKGAKVEKGGPETQGKDKSWHLLSHL
jgi:hypothetical protein